MLITNIAVEFSQFSIVWKGFIQPSKFALALSICRGFSQGKSVFSLICIGKLLPGQHCLNNMTVNFWINFCENLYILSERTFFFLTYASCSIVHIIHVHSALCINKTVAPSIKAMQSSLVVTLHLLLKWIQAGLGRKSKQIVTKKYVQWKRLKNFSLHQRAFSNL